MDKSGFQLDGIDLAQLSQVLRGVCGDSVVGEVVGRTLLRDEVARHLACSLLQAELIVDTMISRGLVRRREAPDGLVEWVIAT